MSAPVDVLAVMRAVAEFGVSAPEWHDMPKAVAAVAELIEAARFFEGESRRKYGDNITGGARLRCALARIGGAA